jgi:hypothetical protein
MFPSACTFIVCWFPLSFTTCFSLHGHLQGCSNLHIFKDSARCFLVSTVLHCMFPPTWPSSSAFTVFHYMFRPTWPSSSVYDSSYIYFHIFKDSASLLFGFHCLSLHVSAYMAIFKCVAIFIYLRILLRCFLVSTVFHYMFQPTWPSSSV